MTEIVTRWDDGLVVTEDGELLEVPAVPDRVAYLVRQHFAAHEQESEWKHRRQALSRILAQLIGRGEKVFVEDIKAWTQPNPSSLNRDLFKEFVDGAEMTLEDATACLRAATGFDTKELPEWAQDLVKDMSASSGWHTRTALVARPAPRAVREERTE